MAFRRLSGEAGGLQAGWPIAARASSGSGSKRGAGRRRHLQLHTGYVVVGAVLLWLLLQYVVEVRVTIGWRNHQALPSAATSGGALAPVHKQQRHCSNTCFKARDGVCDEGRPTSLEAVAPSEGQQLTQEQLLQWRQWEQRRQQRRPEVVLPVLCDLGTDCDDCGPWTGHQAHPDWSEPELPIAFLASHNISVRSRPFNPRSAAPLAGLRFSYVDPALDVDVSRHMEGTGVVEIGISQIFYTVLAGRCNATAGSSSGGNNGLVADVGANFGYFTVLSAHLGCNVVAWEPVPQFRALLSHNLAFNHLAERVNVRPTVVAHPPGSMQVVVVPNRGIWGTAGIGGDNLDDGIPNQGSYQEVEVRAESLDEVLAGKHITLLKVDVEGYEPSVLSTAPRLLAGGLIDNIVLEYTPGVLERTARWSEMAGPPQMLLNLTAAGFHLSWLPDAFVRVWSEARSLSSALPLLRTITPKNLEYDLWDARVHRTGEFDPAAATPYCQAMVELGLAHPGVPERLHPKSFHAMFSHNTNVWASRDMQLLRDRDVIGPPVGLMPPDSPTNASWFPPEGQDLGLGAVSCSGLAAEYAARLGQAEGPKPPPNEAATLMTVLIGRRCRCTHDLPCQRHTEVVEQCTRAGQTPFQDL